MGPNIDVRFSSLSARLGFTFMPNIDYRTLTSGWIVMLDSEHREVCIDQFIYPY